MNITKYICDYLMEYNTPVIVPELGCFSVVNKPSEIRDGKLIPPVKTIEFDSENTDDHHQVFTGYVAQKENTTIERAAEAIRDFYHHHFINKLPHAKNLHFDDFGSFSLNEAHNIVFTPVDHFFKDHFGLDYAYFSGNTQPYTAPPVEPEPVFIPPPPPAQTEPDVPRAKETKQTQPPADESLFDTSNSSRFRENTERRRSEPKKQEPAVRPRTAPAYQKKKKQMKTGNSSLWVLWVLIVAAGLGVAGYFLYPKFDSFFTSKKGTTISAVTNGDETADPATVGDTEEDAFNSELSQTLDDATDKKQALNPESSRQTPVATPNTPSVSQQSTPAAVTPAGSSAKGRYVLIVGSFTTHSAAEAYGKKLQAEGLSYEIIDAGSRRFRVSVASFDNISEANRQANQMKSKPLCENVWVARR